MRTPSEPVVFATTTPARASSGDRAVGGDTLFKAGDRVAENIELISVLGVGGMGDVWLARHIGLDTTVAVKFMSANLAHDLGLIERFAREAKLASQIKSPHVVQIFDFATTHEGIPYIVMELIDGETLESRIRRDAKLGLDETTRVVVQLCRALSKAHEIGIIHRDMKPANVLLGEEEGELFVRILDFGIAKHMDAPKGVTDAGTMMGTPSYMSPEQLFRPTEVDHGSDLWALGVMTYQCLTGGLPFQAESVAAVCVAINEGTFPLASNVNREIPPAMDAWFAKALALAPGERFDSAKAMSDAFLLILETVDQLPIWAVRRESVVGDAANHKGVARALAERVSPARHERGRRRRGAALVAGGAMLVAIGFLSRDATLGRFVKSLVPAGSATRIDRSSAEPALSSPSVPSRVESAQGFRSGAASPTAVAPVPTLARPRPVQPTTPVATVLTPPVPAASTSSPPIEHPPSEAVLLAASESDNNPYSEAGAPSAPSAAPSPDTTAVARPLQDVEPHAPGL